MKDKMRLIICPKFWRAIDELVEFRGVEVSIIEERCEQLAEPRGIDPGEKVLRVFVDAFERKTSESGKGRASWPR